MAYLKGVLATVASLFLALLVSQLWWLIPTDNREGNRFYRSCRRILESILSPWFWILAVVFSAFFYFSSRFKNQSLRIVLSGFPRSALLGVSDSGCSRILVRRSATG